MACDYPFDPARGAMLESILALGYFRWVGVELESVRAGEAIVGFMPHPALLTPWHTLNGSIVNGVVEMPSTLALLTELAPGELPVTNDIFLQHLRPLPGDCRYRFVGRLMRRGRRMAWTEVDVFAGDTLVSSARITKTILPEAL